MAEMVYKEFEKVVLTELVAGGDVPGLEVISDTLVTNTRWSLRYRLVFKETSENKFYQVIYSKGATENQDELPFEDEGEFVSCSEVTPVLQTVTVYNLVYK